MPVYKLNGQTYDIPDNVVANFEKDNPNATVAYQAGGNTYDIPVKEKKGFLSQFPDAVLEGQQPKQPAQVQQPQQVQQASQVQQTARPKEKAVDAATGKPISPYLTGEGAHVPFIGTPDFVPSYEVGEGENKRRRKVSEDIYEARHNTKVTPAVQQVVDKNGNVVKENVITPVEPQEVAYDRYLKESASAPTLEQQNQKRLDEVNKKLAKSQERELRETVNMYNESPYLFIGNLINMAGSPAPGANMMMANNETENRKLLEARQHLLNEGKRIIDEVKLENSEGDVGVWGGLKQAARSVAKSAGKMSTWDFGATDVNTQSKLMEAIIRMDNGDAITEDERELLSDWALNNAVSSMYGNQLTGWAKAGQVTGESLPFMLEMALNPASGLGQAAQKGLTKYAIKKYGKKWVKDHTKSMLVGKIATRGVGDILGGQTIAATTGLLRTVADAEKRYSGEVNADIDDEGNIIYGGHKDGDSALAAFSKAWAANGIENSSEMWGEYLAPVTGMFRNALGKAVIGKAGREALNLTGRLGDVSLNKAQRFIYDVMSRRGLGAISQGLDKFLKKTQWHGVLGEYIEEELGNLANAAVVGDMTFDNAEDTGIFNLQQHIDTFNGVALMGGFMSALHTGGYAWDRYNNRMSKIDKRGYELFADWDDTKTIIDSVADDPVELNNVLTDYLNNTEMSKDEKKTILDYTGKILERKGADMAEYQPRMATTMRQPNFNPGQSGWVVTSLDRNGNPIEQQSFETEDEAIAYEGELKMRQQSRDMKDYLQLSTGLSYGESSKIVDHFLNDMEFTVEGRVLDMEDEDDRALILSNLQNPKSTIGLAFRNYKNDEAIKKAKTSREAIAAFEEENGWEPGTIRELSEADPMQLSDEELQMADQAREFLKGLAYPAGEVHIEHEQQEGAEAAQAVVENVVSEDGAIDPDNNAGIQILEANRVAFDALIDLFTRNEDLKEEYYRLQGMGLSEQEIASSLDSFRPEDVQTVINYFNAHARYLSFMDEASREIDVAAHRSRERHTMKGTIDGVADLNNVRQITDGTNHYFLVSGDITTDPATGRITGSTSGLIIGMDLDGSFVQLNESDGYSLEPVTMTLDQFEEAERTRLQQQVTQTIDPNGEMNAAAEETGNVGGEAGANNSTGANEPSTPESPEEQNTALSRIPKDEGGNPLYEQATPEDAYDALVEQVGENTTRILAQRQLDQANKALEKLNKKMEKGEFEGSTLQEQIEGSKKLQQEIDTEQGRVNFWNSVLAVPNNRQLNAASARPAAPANNPPTPPTPPADEAPEWRYDTPEAARERGYKVIEGQRIDRQEEKPMPQGMEVEVQYSTKDKVKGRMTVSELADVQGSHLTNGQVNEKHFLPEAQPKNEFGADRQAAAQANASEENFRPELMLTFNTTQSAYSGSASQTNRRGEVIQGNGRRNLAEYIYAPGNEAVAEKYKTFLKAHAAELGTTAEEIDRMEKPIAHIVLDVTDEEAIRLGQFTAADLESGGKKIPEVAPTVTKLGGSYGSFTNILLRHDDPDASLSERIEANMTDAINWLNRGGYINNTETKSLLEDKDAARQFLRDMLTDVLFRGTHPDLRTMFYELPKNIQSALVSAVGREVGLSQYQSILKDIQESIMAYHELMASSPQFAAVRGRNFEERMAAANAAVNDWLRQINLDGSLNKGKFSNFALELAKLYVSLKDQKTLAGKLREYYDIMGNVPMEGGLFDTPAETGTMTREQALEQIFGIGNGTQRTMPVAGNNQEGQAGNQGGTDNPQVGESAEGEGGPTNGGRGSVGQSPVGEGSPKVSEREKYIAEHPLTEAEIDASDASQAQKILAKQYLNSKDDFVSEMAKAAYTLIYNKKVAAQNQGQQGESKPLSEYGLSDFVNDARSAFPDVNWDVIINELSQIKTVMVDTALNKINEILAKYLSNEQIVALRGDAVNYSWATELAKWIARNSLTESPANEQPGRPRNEAPTRPQTPQQPETPPTPPSTGGQQGGAQNSAQAAAKARMAAALAKLKKHGKNSDNNTDAYSVENLTPQQIEDMFEVVEAGAELGYTLLDGVQTKDEWIAQMREAIAEPLKDATGYNDAEVDELLNDMWNYPYEVEGQSKPVSEWAAEKGINVNEIENGTGETNGEDSPTELPGSTTVGGSTEAGVEQGGNNEGNAGSGGETVSGTNTAGSNSGTQSRGKTNGGGQRSGGTGSTRGKTRGTRKSEQPGSLFGEDEGNGTNDTPGVTTGGTAATVPESGIVVPQEDGKPKKPLADITQEKSPYKPSSIGGKFAIGSVIPSGIADSIANAFKRLKEKFFPKKGSTLDFVREELGYKTNEEMLSDFESGKTDGLAAEQVDAVALAIGKMKDGKSFIVGDMTGVGKGRTAAALIRWGLKHGKKVLFVTEKSGLFSDMHRDLTDIGCDYLPFVTNSDTDANITDADGNKVIPKPMPAAQKALWQSESDKLPKDKKGRQYDFVMTTYSQVNGNEKGDKKKAEWLKEYAKDAIVIMDESHNASGESNTGAYFREVVENASGVTFLSATYAKRPDNMLLYAIKSSMSAINMPVQSFLEAIKEYGVAMQELMASALFGSGEMIRRERDMSDVKTTWTDPKDIYTEEEFENCRKTSDKTMDLINDIIQFQRDHVNPIVANHEKDYDKQNQIAALTGGVQTHAGNTAYKSQVSNITNLMVYAMKAKKAAEMAIEQIKQGKKPVIAVSNTMGSYIEDLEDEIPEAGFRPIFEKGIRFSLRYVIADYAPGDDGKYHKVKGSERVFDATDELNDAGHRALINLQQRIEEYMGDTDKVDLTLSPIDLVKQMIADAGYSCGEITGRSTQLVKNENGGYTKASIRQNKKEAARKFNGGSKDNPIPEDEQYQALILNVAGATGISLHSSKKFGNQQPRTMIILQPNADVNKEVQMRGRIDRTGQVHRGEYFYVSSPIPAEQKITMMLKQKLASLDAQSVGTKKVSSNKVEGQDMDNKYGDEVCYNYLLEHLNDVNAYLENGLSWNRKTREWEGRPGLLYDVLKDLQRMPCDMQEKVIAELNQRYADQIEYLNQNGINDLETTTMDLEAVTIDKATFVKGKDNESENEFSHDTAIERVEVNVLKKPMRSSDIKKKMKELDALDEDGNPKEGVLKQTTEKVKEMIEKKLADRQEKYDEQEAKLEEKIRSEHPQKEDQTDEQYEEMIKGWPALVDMQNKHKADIAQYSADLQSQNNDVYRAAMYLKPGRPYLVPLTDDISDNGALMYGRFIGFQLKNGDPRQVQAVFAVKDSRAMITIPVVNKSKVIDKIIQERGDIDIVSLERTEYGEDKPLDEKYKTWDEWWDKMIPKNTNRQIRYMITGNVLQACGSLGKYKGQIVTFTRKNKETGEITLERGMLLAENFDPENFRVRRPVEKKDVWDSYDELKDDRSGISCHREGNNMVVKFEKRKGEKLSEHPVQKDETLKQMAMNNEIRPSGKSAILCVIKEDNVEQALEHLYKEYGYTKEELFVMPDSTEKPDAIVRTNRPWQEIIDEYGDKYGRNQYSVEHKINQMLKRYKMDVNNDDLKQQIREAVMLRQAYLRREFATKESNRLAWEVLINDERIERYKDDKDMRERYMRIREAILEELEYRGFKGNAYHYEQGKLSFDDVREMFNKMNDPSTEEGKAKKALFEKVMSKVSKLPMEIVMNEKLDNDTGGWAGGRLINYNWKYMNADYIADQAKADTILHELIHTVTAYADRCVEDGYEHLLDQDMIDAINELHSIYDAIKKDPTFEHDGRPAYGLTNVREMLSEAGSNSEFRADLKKTGLWAKLKAGFLAFFGIKQNVSGAKQVNAYEQIMERLDYLIENFKQEAWENYYKGTMYGGYGYRKADAQKIDTSDPMEAIEQAAESWRRTAKDSESSLTHRTQISNDDEKDVPLEQRKLKSYKDGEGNYHRGLEEELAELEDRISRAGAESKGVGSQGNEASEGVQSPRSGIGLNDLRREAALIRAEIARRDRERKALSQKYNINERGDISFDDLSRMFRDLNHNKIIGKLFDKVAAVLKDLGVEFRFTDYLGANVGGEAVAFGNVTFYNWDAQLRDIGDQEKARILLHEMIHNIASQIIKRYNHPELGELTAKQKRLAKQINDIYKVVKVFNPVKADGTEYYGVKVDAEEMLSELANPDFRDVLDSIPYMGSTVWEQIKNWFKMLIPGLHEDTALGKLDKALDGLLETYNERERSIYRKQRAGWERDIKNAGYNGNYIDFWEGGLRYGLGRQSIVEDQKNAVRDTRQFKKESVNDADPMEAIYRAAAAFRNESNINNPNNPLNHSAKAVYNERLNQVETVFTEAYQDGMVSLKTAQNAIAGDKDIPDSQNAYMAENLMHGKNKNEQDLFNRMFRDPLINTINKIMNLTGMNWGDIDRYVYAKSGLERNREFYVRDWLEAERNRRIRKYDDLNPEEQDIYDDMADTIETMFEDGDIETEEEKNKKLNEALQEAHQRYINDLENRWNETKDARYLDLLVGNSPSLGIDNFTYADYIKALDKFITDNIDDGFNPSEHDYSGFRAMFGDEDGVYDDSDVVLEVMSTDDMIGRDGLDVLWGQINAATRYGLERYREAGMRSDEQIDRVEKMFHFYVPMRGFKEDRGEDMYQYFTGKDKSKNYIGGLLKHAKGRGSEANYPISTIFAMTYKAISDCNQNLVNQKLYRLCQANPNDLVILSDSWAVLNETTGEWEESSPDIPEDATDDEVRNATLAWEESMQSLAKEGKARKIKGREHFDYKPMDKKKQSEHIIDVRINGQPRKMIVTSNPRMAQALNGQLRFERGKNVFSKWNSAIKNMMASLFTSYSPTFALRNMFRDWTHFRTMLGVREGRGYAKQANKYYRQSLFKMVGLFKKYREGTLDESNEMERDFKDFMDNGGITGFVQMQKIDDIQKQMEKLYKQQKEGKAIRLNNKLWDYTLGAIEALNEGIENNARFATYRASRHYAGRTKARSAYDAKEITVNFNKKGAGSKTAGFKSQSKMVEDAAKAFGVTSQILGEGKIFFNATVQAIATTFKNFQNADGSLNKPYIAKWAARYALPPFMFGLALPMINKALAAARGEGDGDDDPYANLPEWTRRKNLCFYIGNGNFITIPIGQELAAFLALGDMFAGMTYEPNIKPLDRSFDEEMVGIMNTFSPVDVDTKITKGGLLENPLDEVTGRTFSVLAPLVAVQQNLGWTGRPIYREDVYPTDKYNPEYQMVYSSTNPVLVGASKLANDLSGGDDVTRGKIQVNPAIVQYLWEQYTGGPGKVFSNTISIGKDAKDVLAGADSDFNIRKVEGLKAFVQQGDDRTEYYRTLAKYRKYKSDADNLSDQVSGYQQNTTTDPLALQKLEKISMSEDFVRMQIVKEAEKTLSKINKAANKAEGKERKELRRLYNRSVKEIVDMLDGVGKE